MGQIRDIIAYDVPIEWKLSEVLIEFERFGDVTRIGVDEKRRKTRESMNIFISYAESAGALRAIKTEFININGKRINIAANKTKIQKRNSEHRDNKNTNKFRRDRHASTDDERNGFGHRSSRIHSRIQFPK